MIRLERPGDLGVAAYRRVVEDGEPVEVAPALLAAVDDRRERGGYMHAKFRDLRRSALRRPIVASIAVLALIGAGTVLVGVTVAAFFVLRWIYGAVTGGA